MRWTAADVDWTHGEGDLVEGAAEALILDAGRRTVALGELSGDGVESLRARLAA